MPESTQSGALTEAVYLILLALNKPLHGYGIMQLVSEMSDNRVNLGSGTLYGAINTLLKKNWIELYQEDSKGKKVYKITSTGNEALHYEVFRLKTLYDCGIQIIGGDINVNEEV